MSTAPSKLYINSAAPPQYRGSAPVPGIAVFYRHLLEKIITPELGAIKADKLTQARVARLHGKLKATPFQTNQVLAVVGSTYTFAGRVGIVVEGMNPARRIEQFKESSDS